MNAGLNVVYFKIKYLTLKTCYRCCKLDRTLIEYSKGVNAYTNFGYELVRHHFDSYNIRRHKSSDLNTIE